MSRGARVDVTRCPPLLVIWSGGEHNGNADSRASADHGIENVSEFLLRMFHHDRKNQGNPVCRGWLCVPEEMQPTSMDDDRFAVQYDQVAKAKVDLKKSPRI